MTLSVYSRLKQNIILAVNLSERHSEILSSIKEIFRDGINSVRRYEQIETIGQLLNVLEIRDILSEENVECLKNIALKLPNSKELLKEISICEERHVPREYRNYYVTPQTSKTVQDESYIMAVGNPLKSMSLRKKERIITTIINEIGVFWRDLGRNLKIRECQIDDIDSQNRTLSEKASKLFCNHFVTTTYEYEKAYPDRWFFVLCDALEKSRRKDLAKSVQEIMTMNIN